MKKNFILKCAALFLFVLTLSAFGGEDEYLKRTSEAVGAIPPSFGKDKNAVLIIIKQEDSYFDKNLHKAVANYKGEYVYVRETETKVIEEKYSDKTKYPYIFEWKVRPISRGSEIMSYSYGVRDRSDNKLYPSEGRGGSNPKMLKAYFINLETKRSK